MAGRPYILAETNWKDVRETEYDVAILPWGATEAHNYHLPYSTDVVQCDEIAAEAAKRAWGQGARPIVLPTVPFGVNTGQLDVKLDRQLKKQEHDYLKGYSIYVKTKEKELKTLIQKLN
ncbi:MAG: creatininase family protein, partial [Candidatus Latescibacterota bacterium]|nr:creatininase family protein [Candidatus Latescibacterota bacterium]